MNYFTVCLYNQWLILPIAGLYHPSPGSITVLLKILYSTGLLNVSGIDRPRINAV